MHISKGVSSRLFSSLFLIALVSAPWASAKKSQADFSASSSGGPQLKPYDYPQFVKCVDFIARDPQEEDFTYALTCDTNDFLEGLRKISSPDPGFRYLVARIILKQITDLKKQLLVSQSIPPDDSGKLSNLGPPESAPALFRSKSEAWLQDLTYWIAPLLDKKRPESILAPEAAFVEIQYLGESLMFPELQKKLVEHSFLLENFRSRSRLLRMVSDWSRTENEVLRPWLLQQLKRFRSSEIRGRDDEYFYWVRSLELESELPDRESRAALKSVLRSLWIAFPQREDGKKLLELAAKFRIKRTDIAPTPRQMNIKELITRAKAELSLVKGDEALQSIQTALKLPKETYTQEELWEAFELHVRILRILDKRHLIPGIMDRYIRIGHFIDIPKDKSKVQDFFDRLYRIARLQWSYDTQTQALKTLDRILTLNLRSGTTYSMEGAYYIRARIMEQQTDKRIARDYFEESIEVLKTAGRKQGDLIDDLMWRNFFVNYDIAVETKDFSKLLALVQGIRGHLNWAEEKSRWYYWAGKTYELNDQKDEAIRNYELSYKEDLMGFYGITSALALQSLGKSVSDWKLPSATEFWNSPEKWKEASWSSYFDVKTGKLKERSYEPMARIYYLARSGHYSLINADLVALEKVAYAVAGRRRESESRRRKVVRDIAWLRLAVGDGIGSIRMAEMARYTFNSKMSDEELAFLYPTPFQSLIQSGAKAADINPWFAKSLIRQESAFNPRARSHANALGLMQMIPPVAEAEAKKMKVDPFDVEDLYRPELAVKLGTNHLGDLYRHFGQSWICATAGYNAGRSPVYNWIDAYSNPNPVVFIERISFVETRKYVRSILRNFVNYQRIYGNPQIDIAELTRMPEKIPGTPVKVIATETQNASLQGAD